LTPAPLDYRTTPEGITLPVKVKPRSSKSRILGVKEGQLEVSLTAAPVDGKANEALCRFLAAEFSVGVRAVRILRGEHSPKKHVLIEGLTLDALQLRLSAATGPGGKAP
jgi:uncharacterized protein